MKASELRIGNKLIYHSGVSSEVITIESIDNDSVNGSFYGDCSSISVSSCEPIPLTPEILVKAGFGQCGENHDYRREDLRVCMISSGRFKLITYLFDLDNEPVCDFVHQLQNLYFALTGEELIFDL